MEIPTPTKKAFAAAAAVFALAMASLAVVGAVRGYWPGPWWDSWAALDFYMATQDGRYSYWLSQHNEHRIVLQRALFWIDNRFAHGINLVPLAANYAFAAAAGLVFWRLLRRITGTARAGAQETAIALLIAGWLFSWSQEANLRYPFQGEFFMAQLLPLCAFYWLAVSTTEERIGPLVAACIFGVLSVGALANGLLTLPLMAAYTIVMRHNAARTAVLIALALPLTAAYFHGYVTPEGHHTLFAAVHDSPLELLLYILRYLGNPFCYALGGGLFGIHAATCAGAVLIAGSAWVGMRWLASPRTRPFMGAALLFLLYVGATAVATAAGRLYMGMEGAYQSRYTTPSLMAWAALLTAVHGDAERVGRKRLQVGLAVAIAILSVPFLWQQRHALDSLEARNANWALGTLALALDLRDDEFVAQLFPHGDTVQAIARRAIPRGLSVFGRFPYEGVKDELGRPFTGPGGNASCVGNIDALGRVGGNSDLVRVEGWLVGGASHAPPERVRLVSMQGITVGFALTGTPRPDVAGAIGRAAANAGFRGYVRADAAGSALTLFGERPECRMQLMTPPLK